MGLRQGEVGQAGVVYYLHTDHLGSTSETTRAARPPSLSGRERYYPYGQVRYNYGSAPTTYNFTGQRLDYTGLLYYGARYYDPALGRFVQADTLVPDPANPQSLNRFAYNYNNPLRYVDPTGHDPLDPEWEQAFYDAHGYWPSDEDRRDRLFSLLFEGHGPNGGWTEEDWAFYSTHKDKLWTGAEPWLGAPEPSLDRFATHVSRLAAWYKADETTQFVRAFALIFGGIRYTLGGFVVPKPLAALEALHGPRLAQLFEGVAGWDPVLVDAIPPWNDFNPSHHYAGLFFLGYFTSEAFAEKVNLARDPDDPFDIVLGNIAIGDAQTVRDTPGGHWLIEWLIRRLAGPFF